jgi:hypothetical protein
VCAGASRSLPRDAVRARHSVVLARCMAGRGCAAAQCCVLRACPAHAHTQRAHGVQCLCMAEVVKAACTPRSPHKRLYMHAFWRRPPTQRARHCQSCVCASGCCARGAVWVQTCRRARASASAVCCNQRLAAASAPWPLWRTRRVLCAAPVAACSTNARVQHGACLPCLSARLSVCLSAWVCAFRGGRLYMPPVARVGSDRVAHTPCCLCVQHSSADQVPCFLLPQLNPAACAMHAVARPRVAASVCVCVCAATARAARGVCPRRHLLACGPFARPAHG